MNGRNASRGSFGCGDAVAASLPSTTTNGAVLVYDAGEYQPMVPVTDDDGYILTWDDGYLVYVDAE